MTHGQGASAALPVYANFMKKIYADQALMNDYGIAETDTFAIPEGINDCETELDGLKIADVDGFEHDVVIPDSLLFEMEQVQEGEFDLGL